MGAVSSAGRATGLHPVGRGFEPLTAHHFPAKCRNKLNSQSMLDSFIILSYSV